MDLAEVIQSAEKDLAAAEAALRVAEGRVQELRNVINGLRYAAKTYGATERGATAALTVTPSTPPAEVGLGDQLAELSRIDATEKVLVELGKPARTEEIQRRLADSGRDDTFEQARNSLHYLTRLKRVDRIGRGLFVAKSSTHAAPMGHAAETASVN